MIRRHDGWRHYVDMVRDVLSFSWYAAVRFDSDRCFQAASALTYTSLLALVPLTTITVGIVSAFPAFDAVKESARSLIFDNLVPQVGAAVSENLETFSANAGRLTGFGIIGLIVTSVLLLATIEAAFNNIWRVRESRPWLLRLLSFWAILTLTPLLFAASISISSQVVGLMSFQDGQPLWRVLLSLLPMVFEFIGLTILYQIIPNRPVRWADAIIGGALAALLFEVAKGGFALYLRAFPMYETVYGAIATIPTFLIWLYLVWCILLLGAVVAAGLPDWRSGKLLGAHVEDLLPARRITIALAIIAQLMEASRFGVSMKRSTLMSRVPVGTATLDSTLDQLRRAHIVERAASDNWLLSRDVNTFTLHDLLRTLGVGLRGHAGGMAELDGAWQKRLVELLNKSESVQQDVLGISLAELLSSGRPNNVTQIRRDALLPPP